MTMMKNELQILQKERNFWAHLAVVVAVIGCGAGRKA